MNEVDKLCSKSGQQDSGVHNRPFQRGLERSKLFSFNTKMLFAFAAVLTFADSVKAMVVKLLVLCTNQDTRQ